MPYNLRKRQKTLDVSAVSSAAPSNDQNSQTETKYDEKEGEAANAPNSKWRTRSLEFTPRSQNELKKIYGQRRYRNIKMMFGFEESEESEEEDAPTKKEFKDTEGYEITMKSLDAMFGKKPTTKE